MNFEVMRYATIQKQPLKVFYKKAVLKSFAIFTEKRLCWNLFNKSTDLIFSGAPQKFYEHSRSILSEQFVQTCFATCLNFGTSYVICWHHILKYSKVLTNPLSFSLGQMFFRILWGPFNYYETPYLFYLIHQDAGRTFSCS